jgi:hypothetical protein
VSVLSTHFLRAFQTFVQLLIYSISSKHVFSLDVVSDLLAHN